MTYTTLARCRACGSSELATVFSLKDQALTGVFPKTKDQPITSGPMDLVLCSAPGACGLVQLRQSYSTTEMYGDNYGYRSGLNASMVRHLHAKVDRILAKHKPAPGSVVVDIGANDGTTLARYPKGEYRLIGIDPTAAKFAAFYRDDIQAVPDFFSSETLQRVAGGAKAAVITSFSMFYDLEDPVAFAREVAECLTEDGIWEMEQSYLPTMLQTNSFDTICHEHLEFYALHQIRYIAEHAGLKLVDVELNDVNGGSFSVTLARQGGRVHANETHIAAVLADEERLGLADVETYRAFAERVDAARQKLHAFLDECKAAGKTVYGIGASTKGNVLLQSLGITAKDIVAIGDVNPDKYGSYTPGSLIPIEAEDTVLAKNPDYLLVLPWHFRDFFLRSPKFKGRKLVFALPAFEVVQP